jgi:hypothetical protein
MKDIIIDIKMTTEIVKKWPWEEDRKKGLSKCYIDYLPKDMKSMIDDINYKRNMDDVIEEIKSLRTDSEIEPISCILDFHFPFKNQIYIDIDLFPKYIRKEYFLIHFLRLMKLQYYSFAEDDFLIVYILFISKKYLDCGVPFVLGFKSYKEFFDKTFSDVLHEGGNEKVYDGPRLTVYLCRDAGEISYIDKAYAVDEPGYDPNLKSKSDFYRSENGEFINLKWETFPLELPPNYWNCIRTSYQEFSNVYTNRPRQLQYLQL